MLGVESPLTQSTLLIDVQMLFGRLPYLAILKDMVWRRQSIATITVLSEFPAEFQNDHQVSAYAPQQKVCLSNGTL